MWIKSGGNITHNYMILDEYNQNAGTTKYHYYHQDLLVTQFIHQKNPVRHIDIGSRIDGFVAHVASFREMRLSIFAPSPHQSTQTLNSYRLTSWFLKI